MSFLITLLVIALLLGSLFGWLAFFKIGALRNDIAELRSRVDGVAPAPGRRAVSPTPVTPAQITATAKPAVNATEDTEVTAADWRKENSWIETRPAEQARPASRSTTATSVAPAAPASDLLERLKEQWMIWLGGISIGLAGIFMVRYSIEQGLLGPTARVVLSIVTGLVLHGVAEWGRRRSAQYYQSFAALAGGASIMIYAAFLAALHLYELLPPTPIFAALLLVSLCTMALAVLHGPVLAILGILGAYVVPLLVDIGSDSILGLFVYSLIITIAALLLMQYVYRSWLWGFMLLGSLGWWFLSLEAYQADAYRGFYLAALAYLYLAMPNRDWLLRDADPPVAPAIADSFRANADSLAQAPIALSLLAVTLAMTLSVIAQATASAAIYYWTPVVAILLVAAGARQSLLYIALVSLPLQALAWLTLGVYFDDGIHIQRLIGPDQFEFMLVAAWMALVYTALSLRNARHGSNADHWLGLAVISPLVWLGLGYLLVTDLSESVYWGAAAVVLGMAYMLLAGYRMRALPRDSQGIIAYESADLGSVWLLLSAHFAYSLAVAIMFREAGLTLALSAQLVSLTWIIKRFNQPRLGLLLKLVVAVVVMRLTLNPWLATYPADIHWSLWSYGGSTLFAAAAAWNLRRNDALRAWLEAATLHLLVLTLWAETRYWLYDGEVFSRQSELLEWAINTALWSSLSLVYYHRHKVSTSLKIVYLWASKILLGLALLSYAITLLPLNPLFSGEVIGTTPVFNILLLAYGFPVIACLLFVRFYDQVLRRQAAALFGAGAFVFISMEIRHLWQGTLDLNLPTSNAESYTYTVVWLLLAVATLLAGSIRFGYAVYRAGFALLMLVIAKIFLLDMADLEGLLRVASFMGLGLSLLGLAYLYQRFDLANKTTAD